MDVLILLLAMFLGALTATLLPYIRKLKEGKIQKFEFKYFWHLVVATAWQFIIGLSIFVLWSPAPDIIGDAFILVSAFAFGYGGEEFQKQVEKYIRWFQSVRAE